MSIKNTFLILLSTLCVSQTRANANQISLNPTDLKEKIGAATGGINIATSNKSEWQRKICSVIAEKIRHQEAYRKLSALYGKEKSSCLMTLKASPGGEFHISKLRLLKNSDSKVLDEQVLGLIKNVGLVENFPSVWKLSLIVDFPNVKVVPIFFP